MAGKKKHVDADMVRRLALVGCTVECIARHVGCSHDTIQRRFMDIVHQARADAEGQLLGKIFEKAKKGQQRSLELCLFTRLGWSEKPTTIVSMVQNNPGASPPLDAATIQARLVQADGML